MTQHSAIRGEGAREHAPQAGDTGRQDGSYEESTSARRTARQGPGSGQGPAGGGRRHGGTGAGRGRRALRWAAITVSLVILGTAGAGYLYYDHLNDQIKKDKLTLGDKEMADHKANAAGQTPINILLIGSDARDSKENQKLGGAKDTFGAPPLADVQMLLHLSADRSNISVVSMPRDTLVKIPKCTDPKTGEEYPATEGRRLTNETLGRGGPGCTVATWYELTGITIDHFMMVDFAGVVSMADAVGGVPVCVDANIYSHTSDGKGSGLKLEKGTTPVKGEQALQWLRTRYGFEDSSDLARTHAQHMYMNSMVRQLKANASLSNPNKLRKLAEAATDALTVDEGLDTIGKLIDLGDELKKVPSSRITMTTMPNQYSTIPGLTGKVEPKPGEAEQLFRLIREDIALDGKDKKKKKPAATASEDKAAAAEEIGVLVQNGTRTSTGSTGGRANSVAQALVAEGFTKAVADPTALLSQETTTISYPSAELEGDAQAVAKAIGLPLSSVRKSTDVTQITLVVGTDWTTGDKYPKTEEDNTTPESARALNGAKEDACMEVNPDFTW
nr:LCP family protein [Streptomyces sp. GC420]